MILLLTAVLSVIIGGTSVFFALQNASAVTIAFIGWHATIPLAGALFTSLFLGGLTMAVLIMPSAIHADRRMRALRAEKKNLETELAKYQITIPIAPPGITLEPASYANREYARALA